MTEHFSAFLKKKAALNVSKINISYIWSGSLKMKEIKFEMLQYLHFSEVFRSM